MSDEIITEKTTEEVTFEKAAPVDNATGNPGVTGNVGVPTTAKEIGLKPGTLTKALTIAQSLRPERYTILNEVDMTEKKAVALAKSTKVL